MNSETTTLLREAAEWRLLSLLFECPGERWRAELTALAAEISDPELKTAATVAMRHATAGLYHSTFGPGGPAAPREVSYRQNILPGPMLAEIGAFYRAFAYSPATEEPPDHIAVEAGFIAYLRLKEAYALLRGDNDQAAVTSEAAQRFTENHLRYVAEPLAKCLAASDIEHLVQASAALLRRVGPRKDEPAAAPVAMDCPVQEGCAWAQQMPR